MPKFFFPLVIAVFALCSNSGYADDIRIDVSHFISTTIGNWNNIDSVGTTSNLIDFNTGASTGVSVTGAGWTEFFGDDNNEFLPQDWLSSPATEDGAGIFPSGVGTFDFSGLADGSYQVEVVSARTTFEYLNITNVNGAVADRTFLGTPPVNPWNTATDGLGDSNWLIWSSVQVVGGSLTIETTTADTNGIVNAIRITSVPEPSSALVLFASMAVMGRRNRR